MRRLGIVALVRSHNAFVSADLCEALRRIRRDNAGSGFGRWFAFAGGATFLAGPIDDHTRGYRGWPDERPDRLTRGRVKKVARAGPVIRARQIVGWVKGNLAFGNKAVMPDGQNGSGGIGGASRMLSADYLNYAALLYRFARRLNRLTRGWVLIAIILQRLSAPA
jgi:hypothetical protein